MNTYEVKLTKQAINQMNFIVNYISKELMAPDAARNLLYQMKEGMENLTFLPKRYTIIDEEPWKSNEIRKIIVKNFLVYFWVDDCNNTVQVVAVIYNKRNQIKQLTSINM